MLTPGHRRPQRPVWAVWLGLVLALLGHSQPGTPEESRAAAPTPPTAPFAPVAGTYDWQPQDYTDSQAITSVAYEPACRCLVATGVFRGGDAQTAKGEIYLDLRFVPELEGRMPLDLSTTTVHIEVEVPSGFAQHASVGGRAVANGIQVFGKDDQWRSQYGTWTNTVRTSAPTTTYRLTHTFIRGTPGMEWSDKGFEPSRLIVVGIKWALGDGSTHTYSGPLYVKRMHFDPPLPSSPRPATHPLPEIFTPQDHVTVNGPTTVLNGKPWFIVGGNWRGLDYGQNFGATRWWPWGNGLSRHVNYGEASLQRFQNTGLKVLRMGLVKDGRVVLSPEGQVVGYDALFKRDVRTLLDMAAAHDLKIAFTLLDFLIGGQAETVNGVALRGRRHLLTDTAVAHQFVRDFLRPFLRDFGTHRALMAIDVLNEPEWLVSAAEGGGWDAVAEQRLKAPSPVPLGVLQAFIAMCIDVIKVEAPGVLVTVGVSSKYAGILAGLPVDYYALHHYPHFGDLQPYLTQIPAGRAWVLEEYPTRKTPTRPAEYLELVRRLGGTGALLWNLRPDSDEHTYRLAERDATLAEIQAWVLAHRAVTLPETDASPGAAGRRP